MAKGSTKVKGLETVVGNLNRQLAGIKERTNAGVFAVALRIEGGAKKMVPREHGILINSGYTQKSPDTPGAYEVGFSAGYAVYVHENLEMKLAGRPRPSGIGVYWGPSGQSRFLAREVDNAKGYALPTIKAYAEVKGK